MGKLKKAIFVFGVIGLFDFSHGTALASGTCAEVFTRASSVIQAEVKAKLIREGIISGSRPMTLATILEYLSAVHASASIGSKVPDVSSLDAVGKSKIRDIHGYVDKVYLRTFAENLPFIRQLARISRSKSINWRLRPVGSEKEFENEVLRALRLVFAFERRPLGLIATFRTSRMEALETFGREAEQYLLWQNLLKLRFGSEAPAGLTGQDEVITRFKRIFQSIFIGTETAILQDLNLTPEIRDMMIRGSIEEVFELVRRKYGFEISLKWTMARAHRTLQIYSVAMATVLAYHSLELRHIFQQQSGIDFSQLIETAPLTLEKGRMLWNGLSIDQVQEILSKVAQTYPPGDVSPEELEYLNSFTRQPR